MKLAILPLTITYFTLLLAGPAAMAATLEDCTKQYKISVDKPYAADDAESTVNKRCRAAGHGSGCSVSYEYMWRKYGEYSSRSVGICKDVVRGQEEHTGANRAAFKEAKDLSNDGQESLRVLKKNQEEDMDRLLSFRDQNLKNAETLAEREGAEQKKAAAALAKKIKAAENLSEKDRKKLDSEINKAKIPDGAKDELYAAADAARFRTMVGIDAKGRGETADKLKGQAEKTAKSEKESGGFDMKDATGVLGVATAGMGLLSAMKGQSGDAAASNLSGATAPAPAAPSVATLPSSQTNGSSLGSTSGGPSFTAADGRSVASVEAPVASDQNLSGPAASVTDPKDSMLNQFSGALGGSPFSGSATSAGAGGASGGGADGQAGGTEASAAGAGAGTGGTEALIPAGGALPAFAGSSAGGSGVEASLKDIFKLGDPFAVPNLASGAPGTGALGDLTAGGNLDANLFAGGGNPGFQSEAIPGINDARNLFARVREVHKRSVKRGMVTSEAGGKI